MTKKHFIALADALKTANLPFQQVGVVPGLEPFGPYQLEILADFCEQQNPRFNRERWISYINGECGPSGGAKAYQGGGSQ